MTGSDAGAGAHHEHLDFDTIVERLRETPLFGGLGDRELRGLVGMGEIVDLDPGTVLIVEGDEADALYVVLAGELGRLGWTQADMQLFANPKALAQAPRSRVCSMLKDWFTAHLAIQDPSTQERLLFETLKPVISG